MEKTMYMVIRKLQWEQEFEHEDFDSDWETRDSIEVLGTYDDYQDALKAWKEQASKEIATFCLIFKECYFIPSFEVSPGNLVFDDTDGSHTEVVIVPFDIATILK